ncbi:hypothetical protein C6P40_003523 [Pichia californica]|uniref:MHD domain-containing protein n=1 Tax=Pichia californica TaxID=460514 RepID=A0A9P6WQ88_9ASCO|nr:hypothetical protein C6P42_004739 [[Candida] californica]KAG0691272.1 hypothetical protein C6P40_003523 [[Candida] californica]
MSSAIYILDRDLNLIIQRHYREDLDISYILQSFKTIYNKSHPIDLPILEHNGITFVFLKKKEVIFMSPVIGDIDIMSHIAFLEKFSQLLQKYFKHYKLIDSKDDTYNIKADLIKDNYILIYELFDECLDFGIPQLTEFSILKDYIKLMIKPEDYYDNSHFNDELNNVEKTVETEINSSISRTAMTKISWRPKGIFYNKNEFFVNFNEYLKFKFNHKVHKVILNQIHGEIKCKSYLSGMPDLKLGINETLNREKTIFNHIQYHQCVDLNLLNDNTVEFIPPDGEFTLLSYQILNTQVLQPLILVKPQYRIFKKGNNQYKLRIKVDMVTTFKRKFYMVDLKIRIPLIVRHSILFVNFNKTMKFKTKLGSVIHNLDNDSLIWKIEKVQGSMRGEMLAEFDLISEKDLWESHIQNQERVKQEHNDLYYFELGSEFIKLGHNNNLLNPTQQQEQQDREEEREKVKNRRTKKDIMNNDIERIVAVEFQLQNMLYSGLKVDFLSIKEDQLKIQTFPWIMYCVYCKDDDYSFILGGDEFNNELSQDDEKMLIESGRWNGETGEEQKGEYNEGDDDDDNNNKNNSNNNNVQDADHEADFSTALDHVGEIDLKNRKDLDFEEYIVEDEQT